MADNRTPVDKIYMHLLSAGYTKADAAKTAQAKTGMVLSTGRPPVNRKGEFKGNKGKKS